MSRKGKLSKKKKQSIRRHRDREKSGFVFKNYIVCLIDLLGQSEQLKSWPPLPSTEEEMALFESAVMDSLGVIEWLTDGFRRRFNVFLDHRIPHEIPIPAGQDASRVREYRRDAVDIRKNKIGVQQFSDTLVFLPHFSLNRCKIYR